MNISQQGYISDTKLTMAVVWATSISLDIAIWVDQYPPNLCDTTESSGVYNCIGEKLIALRKSCYTKERSLRMGWLTFDSFPFCSRLSWHICNWELKVVGGRVGGVGRKGEFKLVGRGPKVITLPHSPTVQFAGRGHGCKLQLRLGTGRCHWRQ